LFYNNNPHWQHQGEAEAAGNQGNILSWGGKVAEE